MTYDPKCLLGSDYFSCPQDNSLVDEKKLRKNVTYKEDASFSYDKETCGAHVQSKEIYRHEIIEMSDKKHYRVSQVKAKKFSLGK